MRRRLVMVVTGSRAEYGLLRPVLRELARSRRLAPSVLATGSHLSPLFGLTFREIAREVPRSDRIRWRYTADTPRETAVQIGESIRKAVPILLKRKPAMLLVLGDRSDVFPVVAAAATLGIPVAQLHGGDKSGAFLDDAYRGAIASFASLHLPASREGAGRLLSREIPRERVVLVGAPGLDAIRLAPRPSRAEVCRALGLPPEERYLILLQHPVLGQAERAGAQMRETIKAVRAMRLPTLVLYPNADPGTRQVIREIERLRRDPLFRIERSLPHDDFINALRYAAALVGSSSSGIIEAPYLKVPVVNVGSRQDGRERGGAVLDVPCQAEAIREAVHKAVYDLSFLRRVQRAASPYGDGHAAERTVRAIERFLARRSPA